MSYLIFLNTVYSVIFVSIQEVIFIWHNIFNVYKKKEKFLITKIKKMSKIIGIDLGTTNSCVSVMEGNEPVVIPNLKEIEQPHLLVAFY